MTAGFSYRYVRSVVPRSAWRRGVAFAGRGSVITWPREHGLLGKVAS